MFTGLSLLVHNVKRESEHFVNMENRLDRLRKAKTLGWGELADLLEIKRSMLHYLRNGQRNLSYKTLRKLQAAERESGLSQESFSEGADIKLEPMPGTKKLKILVKAKDVEELKALIASAKNLLNRIENGLTESDEIDKDNEK